METFIRWHQYDNPKICGRWNFISDHSPLISNNFVIWWHYFLNLFNFALIFNFIHRKLGNFCIGWKIFSYNLNSTKFYVFWVSTPHSLNILCFISYCFNDEIMKTSREGTTILNKVYCTRIYDDTDWVLRWITAPTLFILKKLLRVTYLHSY